MFTGCTALAQDPVKRTEVGIWSGANFTNGHVFGFVQNRRFVPIGITWAPALLRHRRFVLKYRIDVLPAVFLSDRVYVPDGQAQPPGSVWVYGAGVSPVGAQMDFPNRTRFKPFAEVTSGFLYFNRKILGYNETKFQFTVALGMGVHMMTSDHFGLQFGYKYHHMSNANIYTGNPGMDSQILYGGVSLFRH